MAIKGSLKEASLPDVIQLLALGQKTGCLAVADRQVPASVGCDWQPHRKMRRGHGQLIARFEGKVVERLRRDDETLLAP